MQIDSLKAVAFTLAFIMPGFIWSAVLSMLVPRRPGQSETRFIEFFTLSCINNAPWFAFFTYLYLTAYPARQPQAFAMWVGGALFASPVILGGISARFKQREYIGRFLRWLGFRTINPIPSAWDWLFSKQEGMWARVTLEDGRLIFGRFGGESFASSDPEERDIYLQETYVPSETGIRRIPGTRGCLITADQIATIEFYAVEEKTDGEERGQAQPPGEGEGGIPAPS